MTPIYERGTIAGSHCFEHIAMRSSMTMSFDRQTDRRNTTILTRCQCGAQAEFWISDLWLSFDAETRATIAPMVADGTLKPMQRAPCDSRLLRRMMVARRRRGVMWP